MTIEEDLMDNESVSRLAIMETKLDYLVEHTKTASSDVLALAKRIDTLENQRHWMAGAAAAMFTLIGSLTFAANSHVNNLINQALDEEVNIDRICAEYRKVRKPDSVTPNICKI